MKKFKILFVAMAAVLLLAGCSKPAPVESATPAPETDVTTTASIVDTEEAFVKAIGSDGTWIIALTKDLEIDQELVLDGEFKNGRQDDEGNDVLQRKIALYTQDDDRNVTAKFTLTVPKLTINSPEASIQRGTFKGDLYVASSNFQLVDTQVEGNVYFLNADAESTFTMDADSSVSGVQELKAE